jgi:hypothetical protein
MYSPENSTIVTLESKTECTLNTTQLEHVAVLDNTAWRYNMKRNIKFRQLDAANQLVPSPLRYSLSFTKCYNHSAICVHPVPDPSSLLPPTSC